MSRSRDVRRIPQKSRGNRGRWHVLFSLVLLVACGGAAPRPNPPSPPPPPVDLAIPRMGGSPLAGTFTVEATTPIVIAPSYPGADDAALAIGKQLAGWLGLPETAAQVGGQETGIVLDLDLPLYVRDRADERGEGFELAVTPGGVRIEAQDLPGLFYGAQAFAQLAGARRIHPFVARPPPHRVPCAVLYDGPLHPFRAMHLDIARHFFGREVIERYLDLLAFYRFNVFHLHLSDDQGFRFDVPKRPELAAVGGATGKLTDADIKAIVDFAAARHITVIPEIDMPGHMRAVLASHPELSCLKKPLPLPTTWGIFEDVLCPSNEDTYVMMRDILQHVAHVFPSRVVHVGGDEVPDTRWKQCPKCSARMRDQKLDAHALAGEFHAKVATILHELGREPAVWDEVLDTPNIAHDAIVFAWRGKKEGARALARGHRVVMAPNDTTYFDRRQTRAQTGPGMEGHTPWQKVAAFDPLLPGLHPAAADRVLGGEGLLWTEYVTSQADIESLVLPRMAALAGQLWGYRFEPFFARQRGMLDASKVAYFVEPPTGIADKKVFLETARVELAPSVLFPDAVVRVTTDGSDPTASSPVFAPLEVRETTHLAARLFLPNGRTSDVVRGVFEKQAPRPALPPTSKLERGVRFKYYEGAFDKVPDFTKLAPKKEGRQLGLPGLPSIVRDEKFALLFEAVLDAPEDGVYRFLVRADDGVRLAVDGEEIVVDDGAHPARDTEGEIALAKGQHAFRLGYYQGAFGKELAVTITGPSTAPVPELASAP